MSSDYFKCSVVAEHTLQFVFSRLKNQELFCFGCGFFFLFLYFCLLILNQGNEKNISLNIM